MNDLHEKTIVGKDFIPASDKVTQPESPSFSILDQQKVEPLPTATEPAKFLKILRVDALIAGDKERAKVLFNLEQRLEKGERGAEIEASIESAMKDDFLRPEEMGRLGELLHPDQCESDEMPPESIQEQSIETKGQSEVFSAIKEYLDPIMEQCKIESDQKAIQGFSNFLTSIEDITDMKVVEEKVEAARLSKTFTSAEYKDIQEILLRYQSEKPEEDSEKDVVSEEIEEPHEPELKPEQDVSPDMSPSEAYQAYVESLPPEEIIRENLTQARAQYAAQSVLYKNAIREKKKWYRKILSDLGHPGKQLPEELKKSDEFVQAEEKYLEAKKQLRVFTLEKTKADEQESKIKVLTDQAEVEYASLQRKIIENSPPLERSRIAKGFEKWARLPLPARIALSVLIISGGTFLFTPIGLAAAASAGTYRAVRSVASAVASQKMGKMVDVRYKRKAGERKEDALKKYTESDSKPGEFDPEEFEKKERALMSFYENEENQSKRDRLKKAGAMLATGAGASALGSAAVNLTHLHSSVDALHATGGPHPDGHTDSAPVSHGTSGGRGPVSIETPKPEVLPIQPHVEASQIDVSSRGYIDTFAKLKADMAHHYPDPSKAPAEVKDMLTMSPEKLATKFGFYRPGQEMQSAFGVKGEHLLLDKDGNMLFEGLKGNRQILFDAKSGTTHMYEGKMFNDHAHNLTADRNVETEAPETALPVDHTHPALEPVLGDAVVQPEQHFMPSQFEHVSSAGLSSEALAGIPHASAWEIAGNAAIDTAVGGIPDYEKTSATYTVPGGAVHLIENTTDRKIKKVDFNDMEIAIAAPDFKSEADILAGKLPLLDTFQFGSDQKSKNIRTNYNIMFERMVMDLPSHTIDNSKRYDYDNGQILLIQKGNDVKFLLNGREILSAKISADGVLKSTSQIEFKRNQQELKDNYWKAIDFVSRKLQNSGNPFKYNATI